MFCGEKENQFENAAIRWADFVVIVLYSLLCLSDNVREVTAVDFWSGTQQLHQRECELFHQVNEKVILLLLKSGPFLFNI